MKVIEVLFLLPEGKTHKRQFKSEDEVVEYLVLTREGEAPLAFNYADGSLVSTETLERIYRRFFKATG